MLEKRKHPGLVAWVVGPRLCAEGPRIEICFDQMTGKISVHPAANGYPTFSRAGEGLGSEGTGGEQHPSNTVPIENAGP